MYGEKATKILKNFEGILDNIEVFIDKRSEWDNYEGIKIVKPDKFIADSDRFIVIAATRGFEAIYNELIFKWGVNKARILRFLIVAKFF